VRKTCLAGVFLTDAELDHTLGLLVLREGTPLEVYGSAAVLGAIETAFPVRRILESYAPFHWTEITPGEPFLIDEGSLTVKAFRLGVKKPRYVADDPTSATEGDWVMGFRFEDQQTHGVLVYAPGVERWTPELLAALQGVQAIFVDGTFWSDCELADAGVGSLTAHEMGHLPIGGPRGSAQHLARLPAARKVYIHINNTNPVLDEKSAERRSLVERGIEIGFDGMELEV
jgi:pyrroloquinoline quinone biosynthesis protein B